MAKEPTNYPSDAADKYVLRFPDGMRERLKQAAAVNNRTLNAEIVARLQQSFDVSVASASDRSQQIMLYDMRKTQLHLAMSMAQSKMTQLLIEGQELLQKETAGEINAIEVEHGLSSIKSRKKELDLEMAALLGNLSELQRHIPSA